MKKLEKWWKMPNKAFTEATEEEISNGAVLLLAPALIMCAFAAFAFYMQDSGWTVACLTMGAVCLSKLIKEIYRGLHE